MPQFRLLLLLALAVAACKKDGPAPPQPQPVPTASTLLLEHEVDSMGLAFDSILYVNAAGHAYGVTRLEYYLSGLTLLGSPGTPDLEIPGPWYVNAESQTAFQLGALPGGTYSGVAVQLGLPPGLNQTGALPATLENLNMAWPDPMGGGYHFMKFEGHFIHNGTAAGFAMHLGRNEQLVHCSMPATFTLDGTADTLALRFNLNEVFRNPHTYDLATGNQSMGSMVLMGLLRDNCADAFTFAHRP